MNVTTEFMILKDKYQYHRSELIIPKQERSYFSDSPQFFLPANAADEINGHV